MPMAISELINLPNKKTPAVQLPQGSSLFTVDLY